MGKTADRIEELLDYGGMKKSITVLIISAVCLIASLALRNEGLPADPAWVAVILCGIPIIIKAVIGLVTRFDIKADVLVSIALVASLYIGEIFAAGEIAAIMVIGEVLEDYTSERANREINKLVEMKPKTARIIADGEERIISASDVKVGDTLRVLAGESIPVDGVITKGTTSIDQSAMTGESIPVDGIITKGTTSIDQSAMTGESIPVDKTIGDDVLSGTINQFGAFEMKATRDEEDSSLERMIKLVQDADADRAPIVRSADRWATWIVAICLSASLITYLVTNEIIRAVTVLVVFCPCAFILATPTAVMAAIANAAKHGCLIRSGAAMEQISKVDRITFDKTGTITYGVPSVKSVKSFSGYGDEEIYRICAVAEKGSEHPLGRAIVRSYGRPIGDPVDFMMIPGKGISCTVEGKKVLAGNIPMMVENGIIGDEGDVAGYLCDGDITVFVSIDGVLSGFVILEDVIREDSKRTVSDLRELAVEPILLTGDNKAVAEMMAEEAGIGAVRSECLPADKLEFIGDLQSKGSKVCMVGDGINDAPALKKSDVGIAMGGIGSDIAIEASDITLINDDIKQLPHVISLSRKMMRKINTNLAISMILNFTAVFLAAAAVLNPVTGALVHNIGSVFVVVNSALLLKWRSKYDISASN